MQALLLLLLRSSVLVQHDAVSDGQNTIHTIDQQEDEIRQVASRDDHLANQEPMEQ